MRRRLSRTPVRKSLRGQAGLSMLLMLGAVDRRGNLVIRAEPPGWGKVGLNPYRTVETNPGLAFAALTPPTTGRATGSFPIPISSGRNCTRNSCGRSAYGIPRS
jgi:hypothetical protein